MLSCSLSVAGMLVLAACAARIVSPAEVEPATTASSGTPAPGAGPALDVEATLLAGVSACAAGGCALRGRVDGLGNGGAASIALVERTPTEGTGFLEEYLVAAVTATGQVTDVAPRAPLLVGQAGPLERDALGHVSTVLQVGANGQQVVVAALVGAGRLETFGSLTEQREFGFDTGSRFVGARVGESRDLDGDGVREVVVGRADCRPDCARGAVIGTVWSWDGGDYTQTSCLRYDARLRSSSPSPLPARPRALSPSPATLASAPAPARC